MMRLKEEPVRSEVILQQLQEAQVNVIRYFQENLKYTKEQLDKKFCAESKERLDSPALPLPQPPSQNSATLTSLKIQALNTPRPDLKNIRSC